MGKPQPDRLGDHPLRLAAARAAREAGERARSLDDQLARLREGDATTVADSVLAVDALEAARRRGHEAERRLVTMRIARANHAVLGQDLMGAARRLALLTLDESVRGTPLD